MQEVRAEVAVAVGSPLRKVRIQGPAPSEETCDKASCVEFKLLGPGVQDFRFQVFKILGSESGPDFGTRKRTRYWGHGRALL